MNLSQFLPRILRKAAISCSIQIRRLRFQERDRTHTVTSSFRRRFLSPGSKTADSTIGGQKFSEIKKTTHLYCVCIEINVSGLHLHSSFLSPFPRPCMVTNIYTMSISPWVEAT